MVAKTDPSFGRILSPHLHLIERLDDDGGPFSDRRLKGASKVWEALFTRQEEEEEEENQCYNTRFAKLS